jgi:hypothetical protein
MRKRSLIALGLVAIAVTTTAVLLISGEARHTTRASAYAFDSRYQVQDAESRLTERILQEEMSAERLKGSGEFGLRRTHCVVNPPPPAAQRMLCSLTTFTKVERSRVRATTDAR